MKKRNIIYLDIPGFLDLPVGCQMVSLQGVNETHPLGCLIGTCREGAGVFVYIYILYINKPNEIANAHNFCFSDGNQ